MGEHDELQQKIADIGYRYLQRTLGELAGLHVLIARVRSADKSALIEVQQLAHKIYGSGSMFGFDSMSEHAHALELLALELGANATLDPDAIQRLESCATALDEQVRSAARSRGIQ